MKQIYKILIISAVFTLINFSVSAQTAPIPTPNILPQNQPLQNPSDQNQTPQIIPPPTLPSTNTNPVSPNSVPQIQNLQKSDLDNSIYNPTAINGDPQNLQNTSPASK